MANTENSKKQTVKSKKVVSKAETKVLVNEKKKVAMKKEIKKLSKIIVGTVVSAKMKNTVVVSMTRKIPHKAYGKLVKVTKRIKADTNGFEVSIGDVVKIQQTKPISKEKFFKVIATTKAQASGVKKEVQN